MKNKLSVIVSDFDDTLFFINDSIRAASLEVIGKEFNQHEVKKMSRDIKSKIYDTAHTKYWHKATANLPAIDYVKKLQAEGYETIIMSARGEEHRQIMAGMLSSVGLEYEEMILTPDHSISDEKWKLSEFEKLLDRYPKVMALEDRKENINYILDRVDAKRLEFYHVDRGEIKKVERN